MTRSADIKAPLGAFEDVHEKVKVAIAHDYLTQRGGAERVALELTRAFPEAPLYTSVYAADATFSEFRDVDVRTSWLSEVAAFRGDPRRALPLLPNVWSGTNIYDADVVICSSTGWAHGVATDAAKIVYCHNPARWLYQTDEYLIDRDRFTRIAVRGLIPALRRWDRRSARSATRYLVNSSAVQERVAAVYGIGARVVHPPIGMSDGPLDPVPGIEPGFLLTVGRARGYKNTSVVVNAVQQLPGERLVAVGGMPDGVGSGRIVGLTDVSDAQLRWLYRNAAALVACAYEDFGLTVVEAFAQGTPALCLRAGGYLDSMREHVTGEFVERADTRGVMDAIQRFRARTFDTEAIRRHADLFSPDSFAHQLRREVADVFRLATSDEQPRASIGLAA